MFVNLSEKYKTFVWTPMRTASTLSSKIFSNFDFKYYKVIDGILVTEKQKFNHTHSFETFIGHDDYKLVLTCRNPYTQYVSLLNHVRKESFKTRKESLERWIQGDQNVVPKLKKRKADFFIKVENLYEDYLSLPFIRDSQFSKSGQLKKEIDSFYNKSPEPYNWRDYINQDLADMIYYSTSSYFELLGYDRNSWKK